MQVIPYLYFPGNAEEAVLFYAAILKAEPPKFMRYKDQPSPGMPEEIGDKILHTELIFDSGAIYVSDSMGQGEVAAGSNVQLNLNCDSPEQIRAVFEGLKEGGKVNMALEDTFWGATFGSVVDKYGIYWSLNYQKPQE